MNTSRVCTFVAGLSAHPSSRTLVNPYASKRCRANLRAYLRALLAYPYSGHLLVGEAPGHRGCALTGIPFTDERMLRCGSHRFLRSIRNKVTVEGWTAESTAGIVWSHLCECPSLPAFWNAVPFHPRSVLRPNRVPTTNEIRTGQCFLRELIDVLCPHTVVAVGRKAEAALKLLGHANVKAVRHPSHGGKQSFIAGLALAGITARTSAPPRGPRS